VFYAVPARWGFEAAVVPNRNELVDHKSWSIDLHQPDPTSASGDFIEDGYFKCATAQMAGEDFKGSWGFYTYEQPAVPYAVLGGYMLALLIVLTVVLKRRDPV